MLTSEQLDEFRRTGHVTVLDVFDDQQIGMALDDVTRWSEEFLGTLPQEQRDWYLERSHDGDQALRKLDNPVFHRTIFRQLAKHRPLTDIVQQLIGSGVSVFFSQVFMKPPGVGGPKPIHQDNFYFGPENRDATLTAWIALDDATTENGCLFYCDEHQMEVFPHVAPESEPFNLQISREIASGLAMFPAPVPRGGVSFHHGNTPHQSSANHSPHARRAAAFHYLRNDATLTHPALPYDDGVRVVVS